jgi:hypothetical protein
MGKGEADFQDTEYVLKFFGQSMRQSRRAYKSFVAKAVKLGRRPDLSGGSRPDLSGGSRAGGAGDVKKGSRDVTQK